MPDAAPPATKNKPALSVPELVAMVAALSALNALSMDVMLPAIRRNSAITTAAD